VRLLTATGRAEQLGTELRATSLLLDRVATYLWGGRTELAQARQLYERALAIHEAQLGPDHPNTVKARQSVASVLRELGERGEAAGD